MKDLFCSQKLNSIPVKYNSIIPKMKNNYLICIRHCIEMATPVYLIYHCFPWDISKNPSLIFSY